MAYTQKCQITGEEFIIRDEDIEFYKMVSPDFRGRQILIPPPKLCPRERERRRLAYRNDRKFYKRTSSFSGEKMLSIYRPDSPYKIYTHDEWWSDAWDAGDYGREFDFSRGFFEQFRELQLAVPRPPLINNKAENSLYCNFADANKNCYLLTSSNRNQDVYYGFLVVDCADSAELLWCTKSELLYECVDCQGCYNCNFCQDCSSCMDSDYCYDCKGCRSCFGCAGLRKKEFHIFNKKYSKQEYFARVKELKATGDFKKQIDELQRKVPRIYLKGTQNENVVGDNIYNSKNIFLGFDVFNSQDCAYVHDGLGAANCCDVCFFDGVELCYESTSLIGYGYRFTSFCRDSAEMFYCDNCHGCKNCFGCTGLRKKEFRIFNKQYSKEDYFDLFSRTASYMQHTGEWGEFFPAKYSMFKYEETLANDYFPISK